MNDPLEDRLRRLRASALPPDMVLRLSAPPLRPAARRRNIIRLALGTGVAAAAASIAVMLSTLPPPAAGSAPVFADSSARRVEDVRPLAVVSEGQRAWELVEVKWVDESTHVSAADRPMAFLVSHTRRSVVPVEITLD